MNHHSAAVKIAPPSHKTRNNALELGGELLLCDPSGVLFWPDESCLIVSDLHLEKGSSFAARGQLLPPYDTKSTLRMLASAVARWNPSRIVSLGDSFHDNGGSGRMAQCDRGTLRSLMEGRDWIWISGNHDPDPPKEIPGVFAEEISIGSITLRHQPSMAANGPEIAGHLHPQARIVRRGKSVRRRCFVSDGNRLIMPSFGAFTGGLNVRDAAFHGLFDERLLEAHVIGKSAIYRIDGRQLV